MTSFDANDVFNLAETAAVATLQGDAWLGNSGNVALIHQKIRQGDDPLELYYAHELPAIGVLATGGSADARQTMQTFDEFVRLGFEVWGAGAEFDQVDTRIKEIVARVRRLLRLQTFAPAIHAASSQLDGLLAEGEIENEEWEIEHFSDGHGGWLVHGVTVSLLTFISGE